MANKKRIKLTQSIFVEGVSKEKGTIVALDESEANYLIACNKAEEEAEKGASKEK